MIEAQPRDLGVLARNGTARQFAAALLEGSAVGIVLLEADAKRLPTRLPETDRVVPLDTALQTFEATHVDYRVAQVGANRLLILPRAPHPCSDLLGRVGTITTSGAAFEVLHRIYLAWSGQEEDVPPGLVGSGPASDLRFSPFAAPVTLRIDSGTLMDALSALCDQVPGLGWAVQAKTLERADPGTGRRQMTVCNLSLFSRTRQLTTGSDLVAH